jgi:hypothetical protein
MENFDACQRPVQKALGGSQIHTISERVVHVNNPRLRADLASEARRTILLQSELSALQASIQQENPSPSEAEADPESLISILENSISQKHALIQAKKDELGLLPEADLSDTATPSPTVDEQIADCMGRIARLRELLEGDNIDGDQELINVKARNAALIHRKTVELCELEEERRQKVAAQLDNAAPATETRVNPTKQSALPLKWELQKLQRRKAELLLSLKRLEKAVVLPNKRPPA